MTKPQSDEGGGMSRPKIDRDKLMIDVATMEFCKMQNKKEIVPLKDFHARVLARVADTIGGKTRFPLFDRRFYWSRKEQPKQAREGEL